jgi:hypothetical protein
MDTQQQKQQQLWQKNKWSCVSMSPVSPSLGCLVGNAACAIRRELDFCAGGIGMQHGVGYRVFDSDSVFVRTVVHVGWLSGGRVCPATVLAQGMVPISLTAL